MKKHILLLSLCLTYCLTFAQENKTRSLKLTAEDWSFKTDKVKFSEDEAVPVMKILPGAEKVIARELNFSEGTIEFDVKPNSLTFYFHYQDARENECLYFRMGQAGNPTAMDALQYAPVIDGVLMWDIYPHFQSNADFTKEAWNHVKLVISGAQMHMYVNQTQQPTLVVDQLEGKPKSGTIAFEGDMEISNLVIKSEKREVLSSSPGIDPTSNDSRYIRSWAVSEPFITPVNVDFSYDFLPTPVTSWQVQQTERRGLLNLTRIYGSNEARSVIWLKVRVQSSVDQTKRLNVGFVDDLWVFLNGQMVYLDKNLQGRLMEKVPGGRCSIENTSFDLPLKRGANELLIGLGHDAFWGRGAIARFNDMEGIEIVPDPTFDSRIVELSEQVIHTYEGYYQMPDGTVAQVARKEKMITISGETINIPQMYPASKNKFFSREKNVEVEFMGKNQGKSVKMILYNNGKQLLELPRVE